MPGGRRVHSKDLCRYMQETNGGRAPFGNGGFFWGRTGSLREIYNAMNATAEYKDMEYDQGILQLMQMKRPDLLGIDTQQRYVYIGAFGNLTEEYGHSARDILDTPWNAPGRLHWPTSKVDGNEPVAIHFNGPSRHEWKPTKRLVREILGRKQG